MIMIKKTSRSFYLSSIFLFISFLLLPKQNIYSQTITWDGSEDISWSTAGNWDLNRIPTASDEVIINVNETIVQINGQALAKQVLVSSGSIWITSTGALTTDELKLSTGAGLGGGGTLNGNLIAEDLSTITPYDILVENQIPVITPDTLTINGNFSNDTSILNILVNNISDHSAVMVSGQTTLNSFLIIAESATYAPSFNDEINFILGDIAIQDTFVFSGPE